MRVIVIYEHLISFWYRGIHVLIGQKLLWRVSLSLGSLKICVIPNHLLLFKGSNQPRRWIYLLILLSELNQALWRILFGVFTIRWLRRRFCPLVVGDHKHFSCTLLRLIVLVLGSASDLIAEMILLFLIFSSLECFFLRLLQSLWSIIWLRAEFASLVV